MRIVIQRVKEAKVIVDGKVSGKIGKGILVFLGIHRDDHIEKTQWLVNKLLNLKIFQDENGKMNQTVKEVQGEVLVVSQFTLYGDCVNGRRPDFVESMTGVSASEIYHRFVAEVKKELGTVQTGIFGASMEVALVNDGPVTFIIDGK